MNVCVVIIDYFLQTLLLEKRLVNQAITKFLGSHIKKYSTSIIVLLRIRFDQFVENTKTGSCWSSSRFLDSENGYQGILGGT